MDRTYKKLEKYLRKANLALTVVIVLLAGYIILTPFIPQLELWYKQKADNTNGFVYNSELAQQYVKAGLISADALKEVPNENRLVIPSIQVNGEVFEGNEEVLDKGIWHRPGTSTPDIGGNSVFVAHRFLFTDGPNTFYHLDKVQKGEKFIVFWEGSEYTYEIYDIQIVNPEDVEIEENTTKSIITLYTCTPLWTSSQRLVVKGRLV